KQFGASAAPRSTPRHPARRQRCRRRSLDRGAAGPTGELARALFVSQLLTLLTVEDRANLGDTRIHNLEELALAGLTKYVAPIVAVGPELGVLECYVNAPEDREPQVIAVADERRDHDDRVD